MATKEQESPLHGRVIHSTPRHPFNAANNNNGINGDADGNGDGKDVHRLDIHAVTRLQENYVKHFIEELNGFDNIIWEIGNECHRESINWQYHMIDFIKKYEANKPKQHLVWINSSSEHVFADACHADVVSPTKGDYPTNPLHNTSKKIVIADSDHMSPLKVQHDWAWKCFTRGLNPILMDCKYQSLAWWKGGGFQPQHPKWQNIRNALGIMQTIAHHMNLAQMKPQSSKATTPSSTRYCLYNTGKEYLVYQPAADKEFTIELPAGGYKCEWINPKFSSKQVTIIKLKGGTHALKAPFDGDAAFYVKKEKGG